MKKFDKKKVHPQILRSYLDVKHERWLLEYFPFIMLGSIVGAIVIVGLMFVFHPSPMIGALMALGALLLVLAPYAAMVFLSPGRVRKYVLTVFAAVVVLAAAYMWLLSLLDARGWLGP